MRELGFDEVAKLVSKSKTTVINQRPKAADAGWQIFDGSYRIRQNEYPFVVVAVQSRATRDGLEKAAQLVQQSKDVVVVYAPSVPLKPETIKALFPGAREVLTIREYFVSFIRDELDTYLTALRAQKPSHYIDPKFQLAGGIPTRYPNPLYQFLMDPGEWPTVRDGGIAVVLAEAGQGKTYMSLDVVSRIVENSPGTIPVFIDSSQWLGLSTPELQSIWKTIAHSFEHYSAPLQWIHGNEEDFLRVALKVDLFRLVFDGFDEYVLRNSKTLQAIDVIQSIAALVEETGCRVMMTSRASFWHSNLPEEILDTVAGKKILQFEILPFGPDTARVYFERRLKDADKVRRAISYFARLREKASDLTGKGFVLSLVADLAERDDSGMGEEAAVAFLNLLELLCDREKRRQQLPLSGQEQLALLTSFAQETSTGSPPTTDILDYCLGAAREDLDQPERVRILDKLGSHALIVRKPASQEWEFKQPQAEIVLLGEMLLAAEPMILASFAKRIAVADPKAQDLADTLVELGLTDAGPDSDRVSRLRPLLKAFSNGASAEDGRVQAPCPSGTVAAGLLSAAVDRLRGRGSNHRERTNVLKQFAGPLFGLVFRGTVSRFDFRGEVFQRCFFDNITFANCEFDAMTVFSQCTFFEGASPQFCRDFGLSDIQGSNEILGEARFWIANELIREGKRTYTETDLKGDLIEVLRKFIVPGGIGVRTIKRSGLDRGAISGSRHKLAIFKAMERLIYAEVKISGLPDGGYVVQDDAKDAVKFFAANNVLTGPLKTAFDELRSHLGL